MNLRERTLLSQWQDYIARQHKFFRLKTGSKVLICDFFAAVNSEVIYLRRQYPGVQEKKIIDRAYERLLEAYERSIEYPVYLNWRSLAVFIANKRPGIAWAVLQARADRQSGEKPVCKEGERPFMAKKVRSTVMGWCPFCFMTARIVAGKRECCGRKA
jgi:hypothetical protein